MANGLTDRSASRKRPSVFAFWGVAAVLTTLGTSTGTGEPVSKNPVHPPLLVARQTFYDAVENKDLIDVAVVQFERLAESHPDLAILARAYQGSLAGLRAKHAFTPWSKLIWVRRCLSRLDAARSEAPDNLEVVFLHGVICHHLPFFYRRHDDAEADFRHIIDLLPESHADYDIQLLNDIFNFIIEKSRLLPHGIEVARQLRKDLNYPKLGSEGHGHPTKPN